MDKHTNKLQKFPKVLMFMQPCTLIENFAATIDLERGSFYDEARELTLTSAGIPLYCARSATPPTTCFTPGHTVKAGYTPSGKWKPSKYVPGKTDKRAGK